jgi:hypothetical protein
MKWCLFFFLSVIASAIAEPGSYAILSSQSTAADPQWGRVIARLSARHNTGTIISFPDGQPRAALEKLRAAHPRYTCFVARHKEVTRGFVTQIHQMCRILDDDPYADTIWGILTGYDAANAEDIAATDKPLIIERVASGTEVALEQCREGVWYCELKQGRMVKKKPGAKPLEEAGPADTTSALAATLTDYKAQLFVTSGHATERGWQIGFRYRNGSFKSADGRLFGVDTAGKRIDINSPNPKVYMPIGNCLMGHIDGQDAMALAWLKSAGVRQMLGYTVPTWYGYAGWGCLDYFVEQPGRFSFSEAYFANQHALIHRLETCFPEIAGAVLDDPNGAGKLRAKIKDTPASKAAGLGAQDAVGLLFDRDAVVFYGDPAWDARLARGDCAYGQEFSGKDGKYTFLIKPRWGAKSFEPVNTNGSQRGGRPMVEYFPTRLKNIRIIEGSELNPVVTDDFILVPSPRKYDAQRAYKVVFTAQPAA